MPKSIKEEILVLKLWGKPGFPPSLAQPVVAGVTQLRLQGRGGYMCKSKKRKSNLWDFFSALITSSQSPASFRVLSVRLQAWCSGSVQGQGFCQGTWSPSGPRAGLSMENRAKLLFEPSPQAATGRKHKYSLWLPQPLICIIS